MSMPDLSNVIVLLVSMNLLMTEKMPRNYRSMHKIVFTVKPAISKILNKT